MKYPLIALPLSTLFILTGCGGSGSGGDDAPANTPPPAPTVTVTAPASAIANVAFDVSWTSTNAANCSAKFTKETGTAKTISVTETDTGAKTYEVTCTGEGGSISDSATVNVAPQAIAEGFWKGTGTDNSGERAVAGVVTKENGYWLVYSATNTPGTVAGFLAGTSGSTPGADGLSGSFPSSDLREFNFSTGVFGAGNLTAGSYNKAGTDKSAFTLAATATSTDISASYTFAGSQAYAIDEVTGPGSALGGTLVQTPAAPSFTDGGSPWTITPNANNLAGAPSISGSFNFQPYTVNVDLPSLGVVDLVVPNRVLSFSGGTANWAPVNSDPNDPQGGTLTLTNVAFTEVSPNVSCITTGSVVDFCGAVPGPTTPTFGEVTITFAADMLTYTGVAVAHQLVADLLVDPAGDCYAYGGVNPCANNTLTFSGTVPNSAPISQQLATTYDEAYEATPALADLAGTYSGTDGVNSTLNNTGSVTLDAAGALTGTAENGQCAVTGTLAVHATGGNVYDAALTFANGTGTCTYSGAFKGVATYDAEESTITITAVVDTVNREQGFLFVGSKAL